MSRRVLGFIFLGMLLLALGFGSGVAWARRPTPTSSPTITPTATPSPTMTASSTNTVSPSPTATSTHSPVPTPTNTSTPEYTPTITLTPSLTPTPTATQITTGRVSVQSNCRYGPGSAYLYEWGLFPGNRVTVIGRNQDATWVYVDPWNYVDFCWIKTDLLELSGDVSEVLQIRTLLPYTEFYWPPTGVRAWREEDEVFVSWNIVPMSLDDNRGYLIEAWLCQDGQLRFTPVQYWTPTAVLIDELGCLEPSGGRIYTAEKHGYTEWIKIAWPPHPTPTATPDISGKLVD